MTPERIVQFFARMDHIYGAKWSSAYGKPVDSQGDLTLSAKQWAHDLAGYSEAQVSDAMQCMESAHQEWPPTVPQFKMLCERIPTVEEILDRAVDHGPVCVAIRSRLDWYNLTLLSSADMRRSVQRKLTEILPAMRRSGEINGLALSHFAAENTTEALTGGDE